MRGNRYINQTILLFGTTAMVVVTAIATNYISTRLMGKEGFGNFSLAINIFNLIQVVFNFGIFYSVGRMLSIEKDTEKIRRLYGLSIIFVFLNYLFLVCWVYLFFTFSNHENILSIKDAILYSIPFLWVYVFNIQNEHILQSRNEIFLLSFSRLIPKLVFLLILFYYFYTYRVLTYDLSILLYSASYIVPFLFIMVRLNPSFKKLKRPSLRAIAVNKVLGFNIYIGSLAAVGASSIIGILISYFGVDNSHVGFFNIALQITAPLALIPNIISTVLFKKFANEQFIDHKIIYVVVFISLSVLILLQVFSKPLVHVLYGEDFFDAVALIRLLSISSILYGLADFYNKFLLSHGQGTSLRNASFIVGLVLLSFSILFIKFFGTQGACFALIISSLVYLVIMYSYYQKNVKFNKKWISRYE